MLDLPVELEDQNQLLTSVDSQVQATQTQNQNNVNVFIAGSSPACTAPLKEYLCLLNIPACTKNFPLGMCKSRCQNAMGACVLNPLHYFLYNCSELSDSVTADALGPCPAKIDFAASTDSTSSAFSATLSLLGSLAVLATSLFQL